MSNKMISGGVVHKLPPDLQSALIKHPKILAVWEDITPITRNEWICWVTSGKKKNTEDSYRKIALETRQQHAKTMLLGWVHPPMMIHRNASAEVVKMTS